MRKAEGQLLEVEGRRREGEGRRCEGEGRRRREGKEQVEGKDTKITKNKHLRCCF